MAANPIDNYYLQVERDDALPATSFERVVNLENDKHIDLFMVEE